ncbi:MAG: TolC family protein [Alphaproteobacteria bacterium]|nr:TolC family protein [Alphaproteobacteria bacterium]
MNHSVGTLFIASIFLLAGCADTPPPPDKPMQTPQQFTSRRLDSEGVKHFIESNSKISVRPWPLKTWRFQQLNLAAFYYHPDLDVARAQRDSVRASEITAGQIPNPTLDVAPTYDETMTYPWVLPFSLSIPIETGNKRALRVQNAHDLSQVAEQRILSTAWMVRNRLVNALIDRYIANQSVMVYRSQSEVQNAISTMFEQRQAAGQSLSLSASQLMIGYRQTLLLEKDAEKQQAESQVTMASAIGVPVEAVAPISIDWNDIASFSIPQSMLERNIHEQVLKQHADLMAALAEYTAAHSALQLELAKQIPDINIGPGYEWNKEGEKYVLGFSITLPVFNNNEGAIAEATAKRNEAAERFNALQAKIIGDIQLAQASYRAGREKLKTAEELLGAQKTKLSRLTGQLGQGDAAKLPLLLARSEIEAAAATRMEAIGQLLKAKAALEFATETPLFGTSVDATVTVSTPKREKP